MGQSYVIFACDAKADAGFIFSAASIHTHSNDFQKSLSALSSTVLLVTAWQ